jgi:hypothetical protein
MKKELVLSTILVASTLSMGFDFSGLAQEAVSTAKEASGVQAVSGTSSSSTSKLSEATVTSGLKEALKSGADFAVKQLGKENGYLNNAQVKIPLPDNLATVEGIARKVGGDKMVDDLVVSMNTAATQAAPKTAQIFVDAIDKMSMEDAKKILASGDNAATDYFKKNTTESLKTMIKPIVQKTMKENDVSRYYNKVDSYYKEHAKTTVDSSKVMGYMKMAGADSYIPGASDTNIEDYVVGKSIDGLFKMIATKEAEIRKDPAAQTTSLLKQVFAK